MRLVVFLAAAISLAVPALAQDVGTLNPRPLPPLANPAAPGLAAKEVFGRATTPVPMAARAIGFYSKGCMIGAQALAVNGENWQVMRLSRNRMWGHPDLIDFLERFAARVPQSTRWNGILVGDISQPRGGPMLTGHASHQLGLDADIWLTPMPARELTRHERETMSAIDMVRRDRRDIEPGNWTPDHWKVIKMAAEDPKVERVLVNAAIKKALCRDARGDRRWLAKVRPYYQHNYHMHVRIGCPAGSPDCRTQDPIPGGEGCGEELDYWFSDAVLHPKPNPNWKPKPPLTLDQLPEACRAVALSR